MCSFRELLKDLFSASRVQKRFFSLSLYSAALSSSFWRVFALRLPKKILKWSSGRRKKRFEHKTFDFFYCGANINSFAIQLDSGRKSLVNKLAKANEKLLRKLTSSELNVCEFINVLIDVGNLHIKSTFMTFICISLRVDRLHSALFLFMSPPVSS